MQNKRDNYLPYSNLINTNKLSMVFNDTSNSYKFFWLRAIIKRANSKPIDTIENIVCDMITQTYYMVNECHLSLGPNDKLEEVTKYIFEKYSIPTNIECEELLIKFRNAKIFEDDYVKDVINNIKTFVPFCLLSPFVPVGNDIKKYSIKNIKVFNELYEKSKNNSKELLPYRFGDVNGIKTKIILDKYFIDYIVKESKIIYDFCTYNLIDYLQRRNPNVPGIINKLLPQLDRIIDINIKSFYQDVIDIDKSDMQDIYSNISLKDCVRNKELSIDHFVPWTYVANNEIWNLTPTTKSANSSKNNILPKWETYFNKFIDQKWTIYNIIKNNDSIQYQFNKIKSKYINVREIMNLYTSSVGEDIFKNCYEKHIRTICDAAERNGFKSGWEYNKVEKFR